MRALAVVALLACSSPLLPAQRRLITETDLYAFQWLADPQISPDGTRIVYTHVKVNAKRDGYETALWVIPTAGGPPMQLTTGPRDSNPQWSPDGKWLAFLRAVEKDGRPQPTQIYLLSMSGGEARPLTDIPRGASNPAWAPDGKSIAFLCSAYPSELEKKGEKPEEKSDVRVITRAVYRTNGGGYLDPTRPAHIWTIDVPPPGSAPRAPKQLTHGEFAESDPTWSLDGAYLYFLSNRVKEPYYQPPDSDIYRVRVTDGAITAIASIDGPINSLAISPDGKRLAFAGAVNRDATVRQRSYSQPDLFVTNVEPGSMPRNLTASYDFDIAAGVGGDQAPPRGGGRSEPFWTPDGRFVMVHAAELGKVNLKRVSVESGEVISLTSGDHAIYAYSASEDAKKIAVAISTPTNIGDLYLADAASGQLTRLTRVNESLFAQLQLTEPAMIWTTSFDGKKVQSWVQRPPDFQESKKYPLILNIHGGPHAAYGYTFDHEFQWMAAKGYVVLYPNPRGSTSYGQEFGNIIQYHYPGDDYKDLMAAVDDLLARGWLEPSQLGVTGGSGGGVLTNWTIGHTDRFKAAVSQRSIADWRDFWYTADFALFTPSWFRAAPWEDEADFKFRSPITYIDRIKTPLMLIEGEADLRTPPAAGGEQMFRALKYKKIPTVMVQFPGETHELSRSGKPTHRVERLHHIVEWFEIYLKGKESKEYDVR